MAIKCFKCMDTGEYFDDFYNMVMTCDCVAYNTIDKKELPKQEKDVNVRVAEEITKSNAIIPEYRINDYFSVDILKDRCVEQYVGNGKVMHGYSDYENLLCTILNSIKHGISLERSYLIGSPKGMSKTTFANTCIKELVQSGKKAVPYTALADLALLYLNHIKNVTSARYVGLNSLYTSVKYNTNKEDESSENEEETLEVAEYLKEFKWSDFLSAEVLFVELTSPHTAALEVDLLRLLLSSRAKVNKPTICTINIAPASYAYGNHLATSFFNEYIDRTSSNYRNYGSLKHVSCFVTNKKSK